MKDFTERQLRGMVYTLRLALDDQQNYLDKMSLDYDEHEERMAAIRKIKFEIEKIAEYVADANGGL